LSDQPRQPFDNKILFCDVIGFSRQDALEMHDCIVALNRTVLGVLAELGCELEKDVIVLPTGDGMVLNFDTQQPDIHMRAAILLLKALGELDPRAAPMFGLRIGLNTHIDTWYYDINGKKNVVGRGINMAQRIMDLGQHGQILMDEQVRRNLEVYPQYKDRLVVCGAYPVKHGVVLSVAQFVDPAHPYVTADRLAAPPAPPSGQITLEDIFARRVVGTLMNARLEPAARDHVRQIEQAVQDYMEENETAQRLKLTVGWVVGEMLRNAFAYADLGPDDYLELRIELTKGGVRVAVTQPDVRDFDLRAVLRAKQETPSFMQMMEGRGLPWHARRSGGRLEIGLEMPLDLDTQAKVIPGAFAAGEA
jgi:class 3 adenylate cyclase